MSCRLERERPRSFSSRVDRDFSSFIVVTYRLCKAYASRWFVINVATRSKMDTDGVLAIAYAMIYFLTVRAAVVAVLFRYQRYKPRSEYNNAQLGSSVMHGAHS